LSIFEPHVLVNSVWYIRWDWKRDWIWVELMSSSSSSGVYSFRYPEADLNTKSIYLNQINVTDIFIPVSGVYLCAPFIIQFTILLLIDWFSQTDILFEKKCVFIFLYNKQSATHFFVSSFVKMSSSSSSMSSYDNTAIFDDKTNMNHSPHYYFGDYYYVGRNRMKSQYSFDHRQQSMKVITFDFDFLFSKYINWFFRLIFKINQSNHSCALIWGSCLLSLALFLGVCP